MTETKSYVW